MNRVLFIALLLLLGCSRKPEESSSAKSSPLPPKVDLSFADPVLAQTISNRHAAVINAAYSAEAWGVLGQSLQAAEFQREAQICYARATELDPQSARWLYLLGLSQLQDDPVAGLNNLTRAVERIDETNDAPRLRLAQALIERGEHTEASAQLQRLIAKAPEHPAARVELARIALASNEPGRVEELLRPSLTNQYTARAAHLLLSQARQRLGDNSGAEALARRANALPPFDWPDPYAREIQGLRVDQQRLAERANMLLLQRRFEDAERLLEQMLERAPANAEALLLLGRMRVQQRRCADAEAILQRHLSVQTNSLQGFVQLGLARFCDGRWKDSVDAFRRAIQLKPDFAQAHYNLGIALTRLGDSAGAVGALQNALRCDPADANAHAALGEEFLRAGNALDARAHAEAALRLDRQHPRALKIIGAAK